MVCSRVHWVVGVVSPTKCLVQYVTAKILQKRSISIHFPIQLYLSKKSGLDGLSQRPSRGRVLAGEELAILNDLNPPVFRSLGVDTALLNKDSLE